MYNNPYLYNNFFPYQSMNINQLPKRGLFSSITNGISHINWSNLLNNTQKTLNVINQAIPVYYQIKPIYNNAKTMFRMVNALKNDQKEETNVSPSNQPDNKKNTNQTGPVFFL